VTRREAADCASGPPLVPSLIVICGGAESSSSTFATCRDVRPKSVMRSRADIGGIDRGQPKVMNHGGDHDFGATVAAEMHEVCDRLPAPLVQAALVRYGFVDKTRPVRTRDGLQGAGSCHQRR
jgi:hypothetical protein